MYEKNERWGGLCDNFTIGDGFRFDYFVHLSFTKSEYVKELFGLLEQMLEIKMNYRQIDWRESDQLVFVADNTKVSKVIEWKPEINTIQGIKNTLNWLY